MRYCNVLSSSRLFAMVAGLSLCAVLTGTQAVIAENQEFAVPSDGATYSPESLLSAIRTPPVPATPRVNGPSVFGVRPGHPFLYRIPATGDRPMEFSVDNLPKGLQLDPKTGQMTGSLKNPGEYMVTLRAKNARGVSEKKFKIMVGDTICLTPPMGWNSWNCWGDTISAEKMMTAAKIMVSSGLINHGWTYINAIDEGWQGKRGGKFNAIQGNEKFPDIQKLCDDIHAMGLKVGIYSTPWPTSYGENIGGSSDSPDGSWTKGRRMGKYSFAMNDAEQWAEWGIDYVKYDWNAGATTPKQTREQFHYEIATLARALRNTDRDMVYSFSNGMPLEYIGDVSHMLNCWRTTRDIEDNWWSLTYNSFFQKTSEWALHQRPGHWNDPDMLVIGHVFGGGGIWKGDTNPTGLTADEQYTHITLWSLLGSPLLIGCDMTKLDKFTLNLLTNDEVLAVNQDALGKQAVMVAESGDHVIIVRPNGKSRHGLKPIQVWSRPLEDGSLAVGLFNLGDTEAVVTAKWTDLKRYGKQKVRDLWRQKDLGRFDEQFQMPVAPHSAELVKIYR